MVKTLTKFFSVTLLVIMLTSCGIKFNNSTNVFKPAPDSLKERSLWHDPSVIQYKLQSLSGYMIHKSNGEEKFRRVRQIVPDGFTTIPETIADGEFYHSKINSKFATEGNNSIPLFSVAASLQADQMMEITILDKALIHIDDSLIPWDKLKTFVAENPLNAGDERFWVQAVMLTQMLTKTAKSVSSNAQISGSAYQVDSSVYNSGETQDRAPYITMLLLDVDKALSRKDETIFDEKIAIKHGRIVKSIQSRLE